MLGHSFTGREKSFQEAEDSMLKEDSPRPEEKRGATASGRGDSGVESGNQKSGNQRAESRQKSKNGPAVVGRPAEDSRQTPVHDSKSSRQPGQKSKGAAGSVRTAKKSVALEEVIPVSVESKNSSEDLPLWVQRHKAGGVLPQEEALIEEELKPSTLAEREAALAAIRNSRPSLVSCEGGELLSSKCSSPGDEHMASFLSEPNSPGSARASSPLGGAAGAESGAGASGAKRQVLTTAKGTGVASIPIAPAVPGGTSGGKSKQSSQTQSSQSSSSRVVSPKAVTMAGKSVASLGASGFGSPSGSKTGMRLASKSDVASLAAKEPLFGPAGGSDRPPKGRISEGAKDGEKGGK